MYEYMYNTGFEPKSELKIFMKFMKVPSFSSFGLCSQQFDKQQNLFLLLNLKYFQGYAFGTAVEMPFGISVPHLRAPTPDEIVGGSRWLGCP